MYASYEALLEEFTKYRIDVGRLLDSLHGEVLVLALQFLVFAPEVLRFTGSDLDVGEILAEREDPGSQQIAANGRVVVPVVAVRGLGAIDVPAAARVTLGDDVV